MKRSNIDTIVRATLLKKGYPLHFYVQAIVYAVDCLREMTFDDLKVINSIELPLTNYKAVKLPGDFADLILLGVSNGQYLKPLTKTVNLNRLYNYNDRGVPQPYQHTGDSAAVLADFGVPQLAFYINSYNNRGENIGGLYGYRTDGSPYVYEVFEERNEIQLDMDFGFSSVVLQYISDGRSSDAATSVDVYAEDCIDKYINWQFAENNRSIGMGERERKFQRYVRAREVFRGRKNDLDLDTIRNFIFRKNYSAALKT